ncbi:hypothetical protein [Thioclava sp.]|uniref:hypothetical protein n=1 Tax=Thioclava sp. TaxID=1933450 RepID=UPI003AA7D4C3
MAFITTNARGEHSILRKLISGLAEGITNYMEYHSRQDIIARLEAKSDSELAAMGITRDGIVQHVFRDRFHI